jgi:hypothetical protein
MRPTPTLAIAGITHDRVKRHLFPGDGLEAAALLVCTRTPGPRLRFLVRDVIPVLHAVCIDRQRDTITWPGEYLERQSTMLSRRGSRSSSSTLIQEGCSPFLTPTTKAISACCLVCFRPAVTCMAPRS